MLNRQTEFEVAGSKWLTCRVRPGSHGPLPLGGEWVMGETEFTARLLDGTARYAR